MPILDSRNAFEQQIKAGEVTASLLAAVYCVACDFWEDSSSMLQDDLRRLVSDAISQEAKTPSLRIVQIILIYLQLAPVYVREPNHPGHWPLTAQVRFHKRFL